MPTFLTQSYSAHAGVISDAPSVSEILVNVLQFLLSVVGIVAILALVIAGLRLLLVQNNTSQAEGIKKSLAAIIVGLIIIMGAIIVVWQIGKFLQ